MKDGILLDSSFLNTLKKYKILTSKKFRGSQVGSRKTSASGSSIEFSDYREYSPGDDLRFIDWNLYARLEQLFIKVFHNEENTHVYIFLDTSRSMQFGGNLKGEYGVKLAASIAFISLAQHNPVQIGGYNEKIEFSPLYRKEGDIIQIFHFLNSLSFGKKDKFYQSLKDFFSRNPRKGVAFVISDCWTWEELSQGLSFLKYKDFDVTLFQLLDENEVDVNLEGNFFLIDSETGEKIKLSISSQERQEYQDRLREHFEQIKIFCRKNAFYYFRTLTVEPLEDLILKRFKK